MTDILDLPGWEVTGSRQEDGEYILTQSMRSTFTRVAEHVGCDEKTVRNVTSGIVQQINKGRAPAASDRSSLRR